MIKYNGQLKDYKFKFKRTTKRGKILKRCLDIITFDIETSSAWMDPNTGKLIGYEPGHDADYWNDKDKYALPYIWQCSVNDTVYYGRELESFKELLKDLRQDLEYKIAVHNLAYEFQFLINIMDVLHIFARAPHKPFKCTFKDFPNIEFYCTYILTNLSLERWGDQLGIQKLVGDLDYLKLRTPLSKLSAQELAYCERDCIVVYYGILDHLKTYKDVWDIPLTSTGKVRRKCKKILVNDPDYMWDVKRTIPKDAEEYRLLRRIFSGGMTHCNRKYLGDVVKGPIYHKDKASFYPYELAARKYPFNKWCYIGRRLPDPNTFEDRAYIIELKFTNIRAISWNTYIPAAKTRGHNIRYDNGRILSASELTYTCTEQDYITICNNYEWDDIECLGCYCNQKRYLPKVFIDIILEFYGGKTTLKGGDPVQYALYKTYINSLYGMCVTALFQSDVSFNASDLNQWHVEPLDVEKVNAGLDKLRVWYNKKYFLSYSVGCWCTAYARRDLAELIESADSDIIYYDTDSIFYRGNHDFTWADKKAERRLKTMCFYHGIDFEKTRPKDPKGKAHPLGILEDEPTDDFMKSLGAKKYVEQREDKLYMTISGVNKGAVACLDGDINNFSDGFIFDKDNPSVHKLEHTYLNDMKPVTWPDGYKSEFKYGINMRPTGYKLSVPNVYKDAIEVMESGNLYFTEYYLSKRRAIF